jgi:hypothetical protein
MRSLSSAAVAVALLVAPSFAQRGGHNSLPVLAPPSPHNGFAPGSGHRRPFPASFFLGTPLWADDFYSHNDQPPQVYVIEAPAVQQKTAFEEAKPVVPVMIELQGDRYVRHATGEASNPQPNAVRSSLAPAASSLASKARVTPTVSAPVEGPATVFVFRDGHREESSDYSIISGVIYSKGDYWTSGSWSKKILVADLNLPATLEANRERGVHFRLPGAPNEVITRP